MPDNGNATPAGDPAVAGTPQPGVVATRCRCRQTLVDSVRRTVVHPYFACAFYGTQPLDAEQ